MGEYLLQIMSPPEPKDVTHPVPTMLVGYKHADKDEDHEDPLEGKHSGPEFPVFLHPAWGAVLAALTTWPAWETDGHVGVTQTTAVTAVQRVSICIKHRSVHLHHLHESVCITYKLWQEDMSNMSLRHFFLLFFI